jgi:copper chaperone CopZ
MKIKQKNSYLALFLTSILFVGFLTNCSDAKTKTMSTEYTDSQFPIVVKVNGMYCSLCSKNVERYVSELNEVDSVLASASEKRVRIKLKKDMMLTRKKISEIISEAGYETEVFIKHPENTAKK